MLWALNAMVEEDQGFKSVTSKLRLGLNALRESRPIKHAATHFGAMALS